MKIVFTLLLILCTTAQAQSVWRCGPDGRSYSSTPCADGRPVAVAEAARPSSDLAQAKQSVADEKARAAQLIRERQQREAQAGATAAGIFGTRPAAQPTTPVTSKAKPRAKGKHHPEDADTWRAVAPASRRAKD